VARTCCPSANGAGGKAGAGGGGVGGKPASGGSAGKAGGSSGSGGGAGGPTGPSVCDGQTYQLDDGYFDNFETVTRFESWYAFSDTDPPGMPLPMRTSGGALLTAFAGEFAASGIKSSKMMGYGAGFGFGLIDPALGSCIDLSKFDGLSFWIKGSAPASMLKLEIVTPESQPSDSEPRGDCVPLSPCAFAHPATEVTVSTTWQQHVIPFTQLTSNVSWSSQRVLGLLWITDGPAYDVRLDEVTLYSGSAPQGPVEPSGAGGAP